MPYGAEPLREEFLPQRNAPGRCCREGNEFRKPGPGGPMWRDQQDLLLVLATSYPRMVHRMKCWAPLGTDQRNHTGTRQDVRCVRSKRSVGACPVERLLLSPSDLPERQPVVLCSSQRTEHGWRQRVPILSERKGKITAKSCSYAHNRRMSHPRTHLQRVRHPRTGNDRNQKDTDETAS